MTTLDANAPGQSARRTSPTASATAGYHRHRAEDHTHGMGHAASRFKDNAFSAASHAGEYLHHEAERVGHMAASQMDTAQDAVGTVRRTVQRHPGVAVLAAVGAGVLLGRFLSEL